MLKGNLRRMLLLTASAAAMLVMVERNASAEDSLPSTDNRWWFSGEGQFQMYGGDGANYSENPALPLDLKPKTGLGGGIELGFQPADIPYSFLGRVRFGKSKSSSGGNSTSFALAQLFSIVDLNSGSAAATRRHIANRTCWPIWKSGVM